MTSPRQERICAGARRAALATLYFGTNPGQQRGSRKDFREYEENYLQTGELPLGYASLR